METSEGFEPPFADLQSAAKSNIDNEAIWSKLKYDIAAGDF